MWPRLPVLAQRCGTVLSVSCLIPFCVPGSLGEPWGARAQCRHQVQTFPPISQSGKEEGAQLDTSQKGKEP